MVIICNSPYDRDETYGHYFAQFPYELSDFQKYAIQAIVEGNHVLTTAHTGSGKTLSAEFAIRHFTSLGQRVIYTSPIKALSNQKYYEFTRKYPDITFGLLTGDIKTNPDAQVVIMTTEVLEVGMGDMNSPKILDAVHAVVFDEVHYINDEHRGQVWEKAILMLPPHIQMVMLSATIDAPERFAQWIEDRYPTHPAKVVLASTSMRVVPLTHYGYVASTEGLFKSTKDKALEQQWRSTTNRILMLQSAVGQFQDDNYKTITGLLNVMEDKELRMKRKFVLNNLATYMKEQEMLPAIAFVFSRKQVEACAAEITAVLLEDDSKVPYLLKYECDAILRKLPNWREYAELPEYQTLVGWMEKGIAIHHSGMIPILREIVEMMISKGYIKLLFATESFAIGLDCPIRTAVFTGLTKFDGNTQRLLRAHEYTQMAGRAGRRGIDTIGYVVHCNNLFPCPSQTEYKTMLGGRPQQLVSKFHVDYTMVLDLLLRGETDFAQFAHRSMLQMEVEKQLNGLRIQCDETQTAWETKRKHIATTLRTPYDVCVEYSDAVAKSKTAVNKRRKELERTILSLETTHRYIKADAKFVEDVKTLELIAQTAQTAYKEAASFIETQTTQICEIMEQNGFLDEHKQLTHVGTMASQIAEAHPLVLAECIQHTEAFATLDVIQIIGWLSCFTDVRVPEDERLLEPRVENDAKLQRVLEYTLGRVEWYKSEELARRLHTGMETELQYDLVEAMMYWAETCEDEMQCKQFLQGVGVSAGDFTKACLKVCNLSEQLTLVCEKMGYVECQHKLSQIPKLLLKYVATAQSLYV